jgi:hypothetical protein
VIQQQQPNEHQPAPSLKRWDIRRNDDAPWGPWGADGKAQSKLSARPMVMPSPSSRLNPLIEAAPTSTRTPSSSTSSKELSETKASR